MIGERPDIGRLTERVPMISTRPSAAGKFFWADGEKLYVKGATYGAFEPNSEGAE